MSITTFVPLRSLIVAIAAGCLAAIPLWSLRAQVLAASPVATPDAGRQAFPPLPDSSPASTPALSPGSTPQTGLQALPQTPDSSPTPAPAVDVSPPPTPVKRGPTSEPGDPTLN